MLKTKSNEEEGRFFKLANFLRGGTKESMSRLCTLIGYLTGSYVAIAGVMLGRDLYGVATVVGACYGAASFLKFKSAQVERKGKVPV